MTDEIRLSISHGVLVILPNNSNNDDDEDNDDDTDADFILFNNYRIIKYLLCVFREICQCLYEKRNVCKEKACGEKEQNNRR